MRDRVKYAARELGLDVELQSLESPTGTAEQAARAVGTKPSQIAKSLVFVVDGDPVLVVVSGAHRVDEDMLRDLLDAVEARPASPEEVRAATGFSVGGVAPVGHDLPVVFDESLLEHDKIWAAGGDGNCLFEVEPDRLATALKATVTRLA
jgi:prolyl-tRNA editing enzyme YbaK/EbsC (Cys-tRNA(Pro) deacylase)